jgi:deoxycytidine triphosphate deaminase
MTGPSSAEPPVIALPPFAGNDEEAARRFERTRSADPFPDIAPALLNSADLLEYIAETGMVHPFDVHPGNANEMLKPASCGMRLGGPVVYWEDAESESPVRVMRDLQRDEELKLARNSIVYVTLEPVLRMPDYIAARFNLTIRDIYRGLLVGTGPLVDPGFTGRFSVPLHNITCNTYTLRGGEPIAWMEFTKISPNERWTEHDSHGRKSPYVPFPQRKLSRRTVEDYLGRAADGPITSSIPASVGRTERSAAATRVAARRQVRIIGGFSVFALLAVVGALAAILVSVYSLVEDSNSSRSALTHQVDVLEHEVAALRRLPPLK